jgi:ribose transport system substrate-binding protein
MNRFSGFDTVAKTAEAVDPLLRAPATPLKWGVNENEASKPARTWEMSVLGIFLLIAVLFALPAPCAAADKKPTIAVIPKGTTHEFWKSIHAGALTAARELNVEIIWKGPLKEDNREEQIKVVEDMVIRGVSGIVLAPLDDTALRAPVANAVRSGIPVVIIDSDLKGDQHTSFVATDNYKGGKLAGDHLAKLLGGRGKVIMLRYQEGSASTMNREQGFLDAIKANPGITVVSANQYGGATTESAYKASENLLAPLKGGEGKLTIDGIFCPNESTTFGMLRALQDGGYAGKVRFVGFDASAKLVEALKKGEIDGLTLQNPVRMGYLGVKTMVEHLQGKKVEKRVDTGVALATRDNMNDPAIKEVLEPDLSILR